MPTTLSFVLRWTLRTAISPLYKIRAKLVFFFNSSFKDGRRSKMKTQLEQSANSQLIFSFVFFFGCLFFVCFQGFWQMFFVKYFPFQVRVTEGTISNVVGDVCLSSNMEFVLINWKFFNNSILCTKSAKNNIDSHSQVA